MSNVELAQYAMYFGAAMFAFVLWFMLRESVRRTYKKAAMTKGGETKVRLQIVGKDNKERMTWGVIDSLVIKDEDTDAEYPIENTKFINTRYPEAGLFASLGVGVQKAIFYEDCPDSILKLNDIKFHKPKNLAKISGMMRKEKFVAVANSALKEFEKMQTGNGATNPIAVYALLGAGVLAAASSLYVLVYMVIPLLDRLTAGAGV